MEKTNRTAQLELAADTDTLLLVMESQAGSVPLSDPQPVISWLAAQIEPDRLRMRKVFFCDALGRIRQLLLTPNGRGSYHGALLPCSPGQLKILEGLARQVDATRLFRNHVRFVGAYTNQVLLASVGGFDHFPISGLQFALIEQLLDQNKQSAQSSEVILRQGNGLFYQISFDLSGHITDTTITGEEHLLWARRWFSYLDSFSPVFITVEDTAQRIVLAEHSSLAGLAPTIMRAPERIFEGWKAVGGMSSQKVYFVDQTGQAGELIHHCGEFVRVAACSYQLQQELYALVQPALEAAAGSPR